MFFPTTATTLSITWVLPSWAIAAKAVIIIATIIKGVFFDITTKLIDFKNFFLHRFLVKLHINLRKQILFSSQQNDILDVITFNL